MMARSSLNLPLPPLLLRLVLTISTLSTWLLSCSATPTSSSSSFLLAPMLRELDRPTRLAFAPGDTRVFVAEKLGRVLVYDSVYAPESKKVLIDVFQDISSSGERGLLGLTVTPVPGPFTSDIYLFLQYSTPFVVANATCLNSGCLANRRVVRARVNRSNRIIERTTLLSLGTCFEGFSHQVGSILYEPNAVALYLSYGDGATSSYIDYGGKGNACGDYPGVTGQLLSPPTTEGGAFRAQHYITRETGPWKGRFGGTLVRLDLNGKPHPENPDYRADGVSGGSWTADKGAVIAYGLRNPFTTTWRYHPKNDGTVEVWIADIGWNAWEELNRLTYPTVNRAHTGGAPNFGWPCYEGKLSQPGYQSLNTTLCNDLNARRNRLFHVAPFFAYEHGNLPDNFRSGCTRASQGLAQKAGAITALHFVNTTSWPAQYQGALLLGDYSVRCIWLLPLTSGLPDPTKAFTLVDDIDVLDIKSDGAGIYAVEYGNTNPGEIHRILHASEQYFDARINATSNSPHAIVTDNGVLGVAPLTVSFDSSGSFVSPGLTVARVWDFKTNSFTPSSTAIKASATYNTPGTYIVELTVTGPGGLKRTDNKLIQVAASAGELPAPVIHSPAEGTTWVVGQELSVVGNSSHPDTDTLSWDITILHCASPALDTCHSHDYLEKSGVGSFMLVALEHDYYPALLIELTVTTAAGFSTSTTRTLRPRLTSVAVTSGPVGAAVANIFLSSPATGGTLVRFVVIGSSFYISASSATVNAGISYVFAGWSDGGLLSHEVVVPATSTPTQRTTYTAMYAISTPPRGSSGSLPAGLKCAYVASSPYAGFVTQGGVWWDSRTNTFTVTGSGVGAGGTSDSLYLVYKEVSQDVVVDVTASINGVAGSAKATAGVAIRAGGLDLKAINAMLAYSANTGTLLFTVRTSVGDATTVSALPSPVSLPVRVGLRYTAGTVAARYSVDGGNTWIGWGNNAAPTPIALGCETGTCLAGASVAAGVVNTITQATLTQVSMT